MAAASAKGPVKWLFDAGLTKPPAPWMVDTLSDQLNKLKVLFAKPPEP
jgi:hypothetical protein